MGYRLALLVTGASGVRLPLRFLATAARHPQLERLHLVVSSGASLVLKHEAALSPPGARGLLEAAELAPEHRERVVAHRDSELDAAIASGSYRLDGTVVLPCSAATLGALASGTGATLIHRAGAVALKERWPLLLGFRETPLALVHLENLRRLAYAGAVIAPPVPAFYAGEELDEFLDAYVLRLFDHLGIPLPELAHLRWGSEGG
ncbi:MAG TPA: UbiX family flavin prenyltransferase [Thermoanaerobaculia bacterium]|nr:UbiX family flavin prenyltransferase [Thermoanaerobaculia bacterium]